MEEEEEERNKDLVKSSEYERENIDEQNKDIVFDEL